MGTLKWHGKRGGSGEYRDWGLGKVRASEFDGPLFGFCLRRAFWVGIFIVESAAFPLILAIQMKNGGD